MSSPIATLGDGSTQEVSMLVLELEDVVRGLAPAEAILAFLAKAQNGERTMGEMT